MNALATPLIDGRTREGRALAELRAELQLRLGRAPSFEAKQLAEQILRTSHDIALLERQRHDAGTIGTRDHELLVRRENALARLLDRLERLAPWPAPPEVAEQPHNERQPETA